ncbi:MAG: hypothetical protein KDB06_04335, partial [Ilumatobacter sp.]|nr:hypothetical protein [Ilumatobacter sp.]
MRRRHRAGLLVAAALATVPAACGGDGATAGDGTTRQQPPSSASAPAPDATAPSEPATPAAPTGEADFDADDICSNLSPAQVSEVLGVEVSGAQNGVRTCFYLLPDRASLAIAVVEFDTANAPTPEQVCETSAQTYSDVTTSSIAGFPSFAGVDAGSDHDTLVVCVPSYSLVFSGS